MSSLSQYIRHTELYGSECILETAVHDPEISKDDLRRLKGFCIHTDKINRGETVPSRSCRHCGKDLPVGARANQMYHSHCKQAAYRIRVKTDNRGG